MALGQNYNNNEEKEAYRPTVYGYAMSNTESEIDKSNLSFSMWKSTMKIAIAPKVETSKDENPEWDRKAAAVIYLNHSKARIMAEVLKGFVKSPKAFNGKGVWAGAGLLTVSTGEEFSIQAPCLVIRKINGENGKVESSYAYEFKRNYHHSVAEFNEESGEFARDYESYDNLEILQIITMLESYYNAMTGAVAFSVADNLSFSQNRVNDSLAKIASGVGVELYAQKAAKSGGGSSYFANNRQSGTANKRTSSTIDDIMGEDD